MATVPTLVLPGLDGSTHMMARFCEVAPPTHDVTPLELPPHLTSYASLVDHFDHRFSEARDALVIAESFSGPLAVMLAARHPGSIGAVVLAASFVTSPMPRVAKWFPWDLMLRAPLPSFAARRNMVGRDATDEQVQTLRSAVRAVPVRTLSGRVRQMIDADAADELRELTCPIVYLRARHERLIPRRCVDAIRHASPGAVVREIDGPHLLLETRPEAVWRSLIDSLSAA
ncbi:MAG: alpha/beta hydrolase [Planctomycetota bacterium]